MKHDAKKQVHVVDDDLATRFALDAMLRSVGYEVALYDNGAQLLDKAATGLSGCIILDVRLPGPGGLEIQRRLQDMGCDLPVTDVDSHAIAVAACRDFQQIGDALCAAARLGDATALHHHRHALSGLCRILGADHLEQMAHASFLDDGDFKAFEACLSATIKALQTQAIFSQEGCEP